MTLVEYLKLRRQVEQADPQLIEQAQALAKTITGVTTDQKWEALIEKAEHDERKRIESESESGTQA